MTNLDGRSCYRYSSLRGDCPVSKVFVEGNHHPLALSSDLSVSLAHSLRLREVAHLPVMPDSSQSGYLRWVQDDRTSDEISIRRTSHSRAFSHSKKVPRRQSMKA